MLLAAILVVLMTEASPANLFPRYKKESYSSDCRGRYDPKTFRKLHWVCDDCYNMYEDISILTDCK